MITQKSFAIILFTKGLCWFSFIFYKLKPENVPYASSCKAPVRHTLQPLCDLSATDNFHRSQRSQQGPRLVSARLQRSRRLVGDLAATKSVAAKFLSMHKNLAATDLVADRSRRGRRPVPDQSATSRRPIADLFCKNRGVAIIETSRRSVGD